MKKICLLLLLLVASISAFAQMRYINVRYHIDFYSGNSQITLSGYIPSDMESSYSSTGIGVILDKLGQRGYVVEQMSTTTYNKQNGYACYREDVILSKSDTPSGQTTIKGDVNEDSEVNIADVNEVISLILDKLRENPKLLEELGIVQPK